MRPTPYRFLVLHRRIDVNRVIVEDTLETALHMACKEDAWIAFGDSRDQMHEGIRALIGHGAVVDVRDVAGETPLSMIVSMEDCAQVLIDGGADVRQRNVLGSGLLHRPDLSVEVMRVLLLAGIDVNMRDLSGHTPLLWLMLNPFPDDTVTRPQFDMLLAAGTDCSIPSHNGLRPLDTLLASNNAYYAGQIEDRQLRGDRWSRRGGLVMKRWVVDSAPESVGQRVRGVHDVCDLVVERTCDSVFRCIVMYL